MQGRSKEKKSVTDDLRWYEIMCCCCKCRKECKSCVTKMCLYYIPIIFLIGLATASIVVGVTGICRDQCPYQYKLPRWLIASSVTPFFLLPFIKAVKEKYYGLTLCRFLSLTYYLGFLASVIVGSVWSFDTWINATPDTCYDVLKLYAFVVTCVHWLLFILATIPQVYILTLICCCCAENAIIPLKHDVETDDQV